MTLEMLTACWFQESTHTNALYGHMAQNNKTKNKIAHNSCQESWFDAATAHYASWMTWVSKRTHPKTRFICTRTVRVLWSNQETKNQDCTQLLSEIFVWQSVGLKGHTPKPRFIFIGLCNLSSWFLGLAIVCVQYAYSPATSDVQWTSQQLAYS